MTRQRIRQSSRAFFIKMPPFEKDSVRDRTKQPLLFLQSLLNSGSEIIIGATLNEWGGGNRKALAAHSYNAMSFFGGLVFFAPAAQAS